MNSGLSIGRRFLVLAGLVTFVAAIGLISPGDTVAQTFVSNGIDLKIDNTATYNGAQVDGAVWALKDLVPGVDKFYNFDDIKPGDFGCNVISVHVDQSAYVCLDYKNLQGSENGVNEPEAVVDHSGGAGELAAGTEFFGWIDDGDGVYEPPGDNALYGTSTQSAASVLDDTTYRVCDGTSPCSANSTRYVASCWCAGNLSVNPLTGAMSCDGSVLGNAAQTDSFTVDVDIRAVSAVGGSPSCEDPGTPKPKGNNGVGNGVDPAPPGIGNSGNDGPGTAPGNPGGSNTAPGQGHHGEDNSGVP